MAAILDTEKIAAAFMIGQSMGGFFIQAVLAGYPERVRGFVGIDTCPFGLGYYSRPDRWWLRQIGWMTRLFPGPLLIKAISESISLTAAGRAYMDAVLRSYTKPKLCRLLGIGYARFLTANLCYRRIHFH